MGRKRGGAATPAYEGNDNNNNNIRGGGPATRVVRRRPPKYNESALARVVFADPYFYDDRAVSAEVHRLEREATFGETTTVGQVFKEYCTVAGGKGGSLVQLALDIKAAYLRLKAYFDGADLSLEALLKVEGVVPLLDPSDEVAWFLDRRVKGGVPSAIAVFQGLAATDAAPSRPRLLRLCYVLGSSGSGKTFFCLQHLSNFLNDKGLPPVTLYLKTANLEGESAVDWGSQDAPERVVAKVNELVGEFIENKLQRVWDSSTPLNMHVSLVIDEAGSPATKGFFDDRYKVTKLLETLQSANIARSATLVVCGTGLLSQAFSSDLEAYYFRMSPWKRRDLEPVLEKVVADRNIGLQSETSTIADAVFNIPLLDGLSTNARSAYFMLEAILDATLQTSALRYLGWQAHISALVPGIVNSVVFRYTNNNGIQRLNEDQRRRVSAWVLGALSQLQPGKVTIPEFPGLKDSEASAALLLLQLNVQRSGDVVEIVDGESYSASVTPALAIVLYNMAGVFTTLVPGWRGEEEVTALYAAKKAILERWSKHEKAVRDMQRDFVPDRDGMGNAKFLKALEGQGETKKAEHEEKRRRAEVDFLEVLKEVRVYRLQKQLQSPKNATVVIPLVSRHSILLNSEKASLADVIAPYTFLQTKHTSSPTSKLVKVQLTQELNKCCLLRNITKSDRALRGLMALWDGSLSAAFRKPTTGARSAAAAAAAAAAAVVPENEKQHLEEEGSEAARTSRRPVQGSDAYPENLINWREASDGVAYARITRSGRVQGTKLVLPKRPDTLNVTFVLCTNAERLLLSFSNTSNLTITEASLDSDRRVDPAKLSNETERRMWKSLQDALVPGTKVQFLFTRGRG